MTDYRISPHEWQRQKDENAETIRRAIERLENRYSFDFLSELGRAFIPEWEVDYGWLFAAFREIQLLFNTLKPMDRAVREELWNSFNSYRDAAFESKNTKQARWEQDAASNAYHIETALAILAQRHCLSWPGDLFRTSDDIKGFWAHAKEIGILFKELKPLRKEEHTRLWNNFQNLCEHARDIQDELNKAFEERRSEREQRHAEWRDNMTDKRDRLHALINKNEGVISHLEELIDADRERMDNARHADFADTVSGWIAEKERKIDDIQATNRELWEKIAEIDGKLNS